MKEPTDSELLCAYSVDGDEAAFETLVSRHAGLVWGTARRITGSDDATRDVSQLVFVLFARKLSGFSSGVVVPAWLHRAATHEARKHLRTLSRRTHREHFANATMNPPDTAPVKADELLPILDDSLEQLRSADREVLVLRFFRKNSLREIGDTLGISESASQKRVERALERLRSVFIGKGVSTANVVGITGVLTASALAAAPSGFAATVSASALASKGAATGIAGWWASVQGLSVGAKAQIVAGSLVVAGVGVPAIVQHERIAELSAANAEMTAELAAHPELEAQLAEQQRMLALHAEMERRLQDHAELLALREELAAADPNVIEEGLRLQRQLSDVKEEAGKLRRVVAAKDAEVRAEALRARTVTDLKNLALAARIHAYEADNTLPASFDEMKAVMDNAQGDVLNIAVELGKYEFFDHGEPLSDDTNPQLILFREIKPRQLPDGTWERAYALTDGSVQNFVSETGDFSEDESRHTMKPEVGQ